MSLFAQLERTGRNVSLYFFRWPCLHLKPNRSSFDGTARLWDATTGACTQVFSDHRRPVYALCFSPDGHWLATGSGDGWLHIYSIKVSLLSSGFYTQPDSFVLSQEKAKKWSWYAGSEKPGVFEIDWQISGSINRIALALECRRVGVVDITRVPALRDLPG